jgi:DNA replicative helicase MCM subunit Mcm2 (Cdc46/Mcm family)
MKTASYIAAIHKALFSFQMIEEALRICVGLSYEVLEKSAPKPIAFRFNPKDINKASLGKLINMFSTVSSNTELASDLWKVVEWRNYCAHNAFVHEFLDRTTKSPFKAHGSEDVEAVAKVARSLVERLGAEMKEIREAHKTVLGNGHA